MYFAAIDAGCTKIASAVIDEHGNIYRKEQYPRELARDKDDTMRVFNEIVQNYKQEYPICAVGIGSGGRWDVKTGIINFCTDASIGWDDTNIITELQESCSLPVAIENDCKIAMVGESWKGATQGYDTVLGVIIGTGLGGGYIYNGEFVYGSRYGAGEVGHAILYPGGKKCLCGQYGCAEMYCSGTSLWQSYNELKQKSPIKSGYEFFELYSAGNLDAKKCLDRFSFDLAVLLVTFTNLYDPQVILIGGGVADTKEHWWEMMMKCYEQQSTPFVRETQIVTTTLGNDAPLLGAAKIAYEKVARK